MTDPPVWLLDCDGVINGMGRCGWSSAPRTSHVHAAGGSWRMRWAPQLVTRIRTLHESGLVEIRWATTWIEHGTGDIEQLMGLPVLPYAYKWRPGETHRAAKLGAALDVTTYGRRLIWTDDDAIPPTGVARDILDQAGALLIAPDERTGLRPKHLDEIEAYIALAT